MRKFINTLLVMVLVAFGQLAIQAQTTGSIAGTVVDQSGAVVPNATVVIKGESGQEFTVTTNESGLYRVPSVPSGLYTVTVTTTTGFKTFVTSNVKVDIGQPTTVDAALEVGGKEQVVEVTTGGEVLQTGTATVGTTITGRQITETPIASRDALDLILKLPGVASAGAPRSSSINGLPKGAIQMSIDGVDVQDNVLRSSDGFFTFVRPRVDAIEEVSISTANSGAQDTGDGAVQVKFVTRRGTNDYRGSLYSQVRNTWLNAAYWYNNRDLKPLPGSDKAPRDKIQLNQPGFRVGGPVPFPHFGEGGPLFHSGKDRAFFFVNYEQYRQPGSITRTRTVANADAQQGVFRYVVGSEVRTVNLFNIAAAAGLPSTIDPTVNTVLSEIQSSLGSGSLAAIPDNPNRRFFSFQNQISSKRTFLALRFDVNLNKSNSVEFVANRQNFLPSIDTINGRDAAFPGGPSYGQGGIRRSYTAALRSTITQNIVNEARWGTSGGGTAFGEGASAADYANQGGYFLNIGGALAINNTRNTNFFNERTTPAADFTDNLTIIKGKHSFTFGGQYKAVTYKATNVNTLVPTIGFGFGTTPAETAAFNVFSGGDNGTLRGASDTQVTEAQNFYAGLTGRVISYTNTAYLTADGTYAPAGEQFQSLKQITYGLYAEDNWRIRPSLSVTYGLRWQPQLGVTAETENYARLENPDQIYGLSGPTAQFRPGTFAGGSAPRGVGMKKGEKFYNDDLNNFAPSVGVVWSPNFDENSIFRSVFGKSGRSVIRAGYSTAFVREGLNIANTVGSTVPGGLLNINRTTAIGNLTPGTLLRTPGNVNLTPATFPATPTYPLALTTADQAIGYNPDIKTGMVHSYSIGYQRELDKNTVVEIRYVGNRGRGLMRLFNVNERNVIENGLLAEFQLAQQNLYANIAANRCQTGVTTAGCQYNIAYFGPGTGTNPLPITLSYLVGNIPVAGVSTNVATLTPGALGSSGSVTSTGAANPANYSSALFRSTTYTSPLNRVGPVPLTYAANLNSLAAQRQNAINAGLPSNFQFVNPTNIAGAFTIDNATKTWYDSMQIEVRRRLSDGLRVQASYVYSKAFSNSFASSSIVSSNLSTVREPGEDLAKTVQPFDLRHNFKLDATYDLPFGRGRTFFSNANGFVNALVGGFSILPVISWQSGSPVQLGNAQLIGMTVEELQKEIKVRKNATTVTWLPDDIILNSQRAFDTSVVNANGYGANYGGVPPTGRFIAPAGYGNCLQAYGGQCGFNNLVLYGPGFFKFDVGITKRFNIDEKRNIEIHANILDALNHANFRIGGFAGDITTTGCCGTTFGQLTSGSAYRDINTTNDPGGRVIDFLLRFNF
jgi:hypothetical protein